MCKAKKEKAKLGNDVALDTNNLQYRRKVTSHRAPVKGSSVANESQGFQFHRGKIISDQWEK